jgi:hypothetical protein
MEVGEMLLRHAKNDKCVVALRRLYLVGYITKSEGDIILGVEIK